MPRSPPALLVAATLAACAPAAPAAAPLDRPPAASASPPAPEPPKGSALRPFTGPAPLSIDAAPAPGTPMLAAGSAADKNSARELFQTGRSAADGGDDEGAIKAFLAAFALVAAPSIALEIGRAAGRLGRLDDARRWLLATAKTPVTAGEPAAFARARAQAAADLAALDTP